MEHTQGQWKHAHRIIDNEGDYGTEVFTDEVIICSMHWAPYKVGNTTTSLRAANAKLIAAAPEMLDALKEMLRDLKANINPMIDALGGHPATLSVKALELAIKNAES